MGSFFENLGKTTEISAIKIAIEVSNKPTRAPEVAPDLSIAAASRNL